MKFTINSPEIAERCIREIRLLEAGTHEVTILPVKSKRSLEQNRKLWATLRDISDQVDWYGQRLTSEEWKDVFTASLKQQKAVPGLSGGFVILGAHTSRMTVAEMSELLELATAFGVEKGVKFTDTREEL